MLTITFILAFAFLSLRAAFIIILDNGSTKKAIRKSEKRRDHYNEMLQNQTNL